ERGRRRVSGRRRHAPARVHQPGELRRTRPARPDRTTVPPDHTARDGVRADCAEEGGVSSATAGTPAARPCFRISFWSIWRDTSAMLAPRDTLPPVLRRTAATEGRPNPPLASRRAIRRGKRF